MKRKEILAAHQRPAARILLTGATGFVGPCLLTALKMGHFENVERFIWAYDPDDSSGQNALNVDIRSREAVFTSIKTLRPTHVIHLASQSHVPTSFVRPELTWDINVMGTLHLLEAVKKYVPDAGVVFISSSEVYGRSFQKGSPLDENSLLQPQNPYAASKAAADLMAAQYASSGLQIIRLRPFNHIGIGQREEFVVSSFAAQVARIETGLQPPVLRVGNLDAQRDFLDVRDVVHAYVLVLEQLFDLPSGLVLNICSGVPRKIVDILSGLIAQATTRITIEIDPQRLRPSDTPLAVGNAAAAQLRLGWHAEIPFEKSLDDILNAWRTRIQSEVQHP